MAKGRFSARSDRYQLCSDGVLSDVRVLRHICWEEGEALVGAGKADPVLDEETGGVIGFQLRRCKRPQVCSSGFVQVVRGGVAVREYEPMARPSATTLTKAEAEAAIGLRGKSKTEGMSEDARTARLLRRWQQEDFVERSKAKLEAFRPVRALA